MDTMKLLTRVYAARKDEPATDDATAAKIVEAATRQLELFGIQRTTMEDVARRSGVSRVTVYRHFPTKERLLEVVVLRETQEFLTELGALLDTFDTDVERMLEGFVFTVGRLRHHRLLRRLLEGEPELFLPQLTTGAGPLIAFARTLIVDYSRDRILGLSDAELTIAAEIGIRLTLSLVLTPDSAIDLDDADGLRRMAARYLGPLFDEDVLQLVKAKRTRRRRA